MCVCESKSEKDVAIATVTAVVVVVVVVRYNNQWMVVDYKLFGPHQPLPDTGLLWVLEQLP